MLEIAIMIEGQNGLNWARWQRIVRLVEELGFVGLFRSDHFTNSSPPDLDSLELWTSLPVWHVIQAESSSALWSRRFRSVTRPLPRASPLPWMTYRVAV
jgi:alkanesulfonate monooxygenase SsuD/methylene tetrahydromethanopterin reductase-like flavin-dependent oxidoreductase (luciferase family)